ncbi:ChbG/HpnK family deacetylase [Candidatus Binatus sp.]|uniref:ChbG/HpnK family deacetylase n=1 Tax=Candidatus Binatus sp. TaxID=2811406 RepID=UPI003BAFB685
MILHIHSDDMGATPQVTQRMLASWQAGVLSGFSVLANGAACDQMATVLATESARPARIACHLNLSEGPSSAPAEFVPMLVDAEGNLRHTFGSLIQTWIANRSALTRQVEIEWRAQIAALQQLIAPRGVAVVDGHMHVHMLPFLFPAAARITAEAGIPGIRITREPLFAADAKDLQKAFFAINLIKNSVLRVCSSLAIPAARRYGLVWPTQMIGILYTGHMNVAAALAGIDAARRKNAAEVEVVFHVGRAAEDERYRWKGRESMADFYCSPLRDSEHAEAAKLAARLSAL